MTLLEMSETNIAAARCLGQIEGIEWAAQMLEDEINGCDDPNCSDCQTLRYHAENMCAHARRFRQRTDTGPINFLETSQ